MPRVISSWMQAGSSPSPQGRRALYIYLLRHSTPSSVYHTNRSTPTLHPSPAPGRVHGDAPAHLLRCLCCRSRRMHGRAPLTISTPAGQPRGNSECPRHARATPRHSCQIVAYSPRHARASVLFPQRWRHWCARVRRARARGIDAPPSPAGRWVRGPPYRLCGPCPAPPPNQLVLGLQHCAFPGESAYTPLV
eukprot:gene8346-biopygen7615